MDIKVLGTGCVNCNNLEPNTRAALDVDIDIDKVTDPEEIIAWGVLSNPALVIDDEPVLSERVPPTTQIRQLLATR